MVARAEVDDEVAVPWLKMNDDGATLQEAAGRRGGPRRRIRQMRSSPTGAPIHGVGEEPGRRHALICYKQRRGR